MQDHHTKCTMDEKNEVENVDVVVDVAENVVDEVVEEVVEEEITMIDRRKFLMHLHIC